jgi:hypothetical protein
VTAGSWRVANVWRREALATSDLAARGVGMADAMRILPGRARPRRSARAGAYLLQCLANVMIDYHNGVFSGGNGVVEKVGGRPPLSVEWFARENRADFETNGQCFVPAP